MAYENNNFMNSYLMLATLIIIYFLIFTIITLIGYD